MTPFWKFVDVDNPDIKGHFKRTRHLGGRHPDDSTWRLGIACQTRRYVADQHRAQGKVVE